MCARYWMENTYEMDSIIGEMMNSVLIKLWEKKSQIVTSGEVHPMDVVPVIATNRRGSRALTEMVVEKVTDVLS